MDTFINIWNTKTYSLVASLADHKMTVCSLAFDPTRPGMMASASGDSKLKIWDLNVAAPSTATSLVLTLANHTFVIGGVVFEATGLMASGDWAARINIWEANKTIKFSFNSG